MIRNQTNKNYITALNKVTFATPEWLVLQLKYYSVVQVHEKIREYYEHCHPGYYDSHPCRKTFVRMNNLLEDTSRRYHNNPLIVRKCKELKMLRTLKPIKDVEIDDDW